MVVDFCSSNVMDEQCFDLLRRSTPPLLGIFPPDDVQGILRTGRRIDGMIFIEIRNKLNDISDMNGHGKGEQNCLGVGNLCFC